MLVKCPWIEDSDLLTYDSWADLDLIGAGVTAEFIEGGMVEVFC
jgi:hypothetical protein